MDKDDGLRYCSSRAVNGISGHNKEYKDTCQVEAVNNGEILLSNAQSREQERIDIRIPLTETENFYELYITNLTAGVQINLGEYNIDTSHLLTSQLPYETEGETFRKLYLNSDNEDENNKTAFKLEEQILISSDTDLTNSQILVLPQVINIEKMEFSDFVSAQNLFENSENSIKLIPFILGKKELNVENSGVAYGNDILNLDQDDSIYFPLKHLGKHEFYLSIPNGDVDNLECKYIKSDGEESLSIDTSSENFFNKNSWHKLGNDTFTLNGNGYVSCTAKNTTVQVDALYVKSVDYSENDLGTLTGRSNLSDETDEQYGQVDVTVENPETGEKVSKRFNFGETIILKLKKKVADALNLKMYYIPVYLPILNNSSNRTLNSVSTSDSVNIATKYKPQIQNITIPANSMSQNLPHIVLQPYGVKSSTTIKLINSINGSSVPDANVTVRFGLDRNDNTTAYSGVTDTNGEFEIVDMPYGQYSFIFQKEGYTSTSINLTVDENTVDNRELSISPIIVDNNNDQNVSGGIRIRLSWGANPSDLDSHLVKRDSSGYMKYHIYYGNQSSNNGDNLDLDDIDSYGPETITIMNIDSNFTYLYYVKNYSGDYYGKIKDSDANVKISTSDNNSSEITFNTPDEDGKYWKVFTIENGVVRGCSESCMSYNEPLN